MKKIIILASIFIQSSMSFAQTPATDPNWELYFDDEFNTLNTDVWDRKDNFDHYAKPNTVHYLFLNSNAVINNGNLAITIRHEVPAYPCCCCCTGDGCAFTDYDYTSGYVQSKIDFQYGYVEASIKFPDATATSPSRTKLNSAFWTTKSSNLNYHHPFDGSEIDVVEVNCDDPAWIPMPTNMHTCYPDATIDPCPAGYPTGWQQSLTVPSFLNSYHKFAVEWYPGKVIWYFDDMVVRNSANPGIVDPVNFIFDIGLDDFPSTFSGFPFTMYVDYLRAYKLKDDCQSINSCTYNFSTHDNKLKNLINIGGNGCTNAASAGSSVYLRASSYVNFSGDLSVPVGTTFFADVNDNCNAGAINYQCSYPLDACNYNFSGYNNETKTYIQLAGTGCTATVASGSNVSLKAIKSIILEPGFNAAFGSVTDMEIVTCP